MTAASRPAQRERGLEQRGDAGGIPALRGVEQGSLRRLHGAPSYPKNLNAGPENRAGVAAMRPTSRYAFAYLFVCA